MTLEIQSGEIIIDCGANIGDLTSRFARTGAKVYAFEPNPTAFSILKNRFKKCALVECFNQGVMDQNCTLTLRFRGAHGTWDAIDTTVSSSFFSQKISGVSNHEVDVSCVDLGTFIQTLGSRVRLIKMDIEGAEIAVLNSLIDTDIIHEIDQLVVETHGNQMPHLIEDTETLRARVKNKGLVDKINLDWP